MHTNLAIRLYLLILVWFPVEQTLNGVILAENLPHGTVAEFVICN